MKCTQCPYYDDNLLIPIISPNHPTYYEPVVYCGLNGEYELTFEDLEIKCPLEVKNECG